MLIVNNVVKERDKQWIVIDVRNIEKEEKFFRKIFLPFEIKNRWFTLSKGADIIIVFKCIKESKGVVLDINIKTTLPFPCDRCLEDSIKFISTQDCEMFLYDNNNSDNYILHNKLYIGSFIYDLLLCALPMKGLCKDNCKGLCTICGKNLNHLSSCRCNL